MNRCRTFFTALLGVLLLAPTWPLQAQQNLPTRQNLPPGVVLLARISDDGSVDYSMGVVIDRDSAGTALILLARDFANGTGELVALEGGSDLFTHGRSTQAYAEDADSALAVVAAPGIRQPPISMTFNPPANEHELRLLAAPAPEQIAAQALAYWVPVAISGSSDTVAQQPVSPQDIPALSGPLLDLCGQLAGMVISDLDNGASETRAVPNDALLTASNNLDLSPRLEACMQVADLGASPVISTPALARPEPAPSSGSKPLGIALPSLVFLGSAVLSGMVFWLFIRRRAGKQITERKRLAAEAETVRLSSDGLPMRATRVAREKRQQEDTPFVPGTRPPGSTGWLRIEGSHADGRPLRAVTAVRDGTFKAVIGRAGAELTADGPGISRQHARITIDQGRMTVTDLGSVNGTFVNGVRCQRDEIFVLKDGDQLLLGAAPVTVKLSKARGNGP